MLGLIHAATVIVPVMSSEELSGALAYWLVPLSESALPTLPATNVGPPVVGASLAGAAPVSCAVGLLVVSSIDQ